jgi:tetratricopeptide (TPR) repeat protein
MRICGRYSPLALILILFFSGTLSAQSQDSQQNQSLGDMARQLRNKKQPVTTTATSGADKVAPAKPAESDAAVVTRPAEIDEYMRAVSFQMYRGDYAELDKMADEARTTKARFPGGGWKLYTIYVQLQNVGEDASDADWQQHLVFFQHWIKARPQSITARVALAAAYIDYAWVARGNGYADQVTPEGSRLFEERLEQGANVLIEASKLEAKCPQWYVNFQTIGRAQGLDKAELAKIFEKGAAYAPDYYYIHQQQAISLLPKWEGDQGDTEAFAEGSYRRAGGGEKGALLYFQIASNLCDKCGDFDPRRFSWPKLQEGFTALEKSYGLTPLWLNKYARMAVLYSDKNAAEKTFARIGSNWDESVWGSRAEFDAHRAWAGLTAVPQPKPKPAFTLDTQQTEQLNTLLSAANQASAESRWNDASQNLHRIIETAKPFPGTDYWLLKAYLLLAANEQRQGRLAEAKSIFDEEVKLVSSRNGAESNEVATALDGRAMLAQKMNDNKSAEADLRRAMAIRRKGSGSSMYLSTEAYALAMVYRRQSRYKEAIGVLKPLIPATADPDPHKEQAYVWLLQGLGMCYQDLGEYVKAEAAYTRMIRILEVTLPVNSVGFTEPLSKMASLYHAMGNEAEAQKIEHRLKELQQSQQGK